MRLATVTDFNGSAVHPFVGPRRRARRAFGLEVYDQPHWLAAEIRGVPHFPRAVDVVIDRHIRSVHAVNPRFVMMPCAQRIGYRTCLRRDIRGRAKRVLPASGVAFELHDVALRRPGLRAIEPHCGPAPGGGGTFELPVDGPVQMRAVHLDNRFAPDGSGFKTITRIGTGGYRVQGH